jgi:glyceraldehyde-3-phosphate dehydrogenase/erythrose-4-phosphate dehydrogenase
VTVDLDRTVSGRDAAREAAEDRVVRQQVGKGGGLNQIVDSDHQTEPHRLPWAELEVDVVIESTGHFWTPR